MSGVLRALGRLGLVVALTSCSSAGDPKPAEYSAASGVLVAVVRAPLDATWTATRAALDALHLRPHDLERDSFSAVFVGDTPEGKEVRVSLRTMTRSTTEVTIRIVGVHDRAKLDAIHAAIIEHL